MDRKRTVTKDPYNPEFKDAFQFNEAYPSSEKIYQEEDGTCTQMYYAKQGIITEEMAFIAARCVRAWMPSLSVQKWRVALPVGTVPIYQALEK
ncbi:unnamed protein product, partial [Durusdinium trenchii]